MNTVMLTAAELTEKIEAAEKAGLRVYVESGSVGTEDYDTGWAYVGNRGDLMVSWDSGAHAMLCPDHTTRITDIR